MNPQIRAFIEMLKANTPADAPKMWQLTPQQAREQSARFYAPFNEGGPEAAEVRDLRVPGRRGSIPARLYVPRSAPRARPECCTCTEAASSWAAPRPTTA